MNKIHMKDVINTTYRINLINKTKIICGITLLLLGCDLNIGGAKDPDLQPAAEILRFEYSPSNVVSVGDTLTITCITKDPSNSTLRFNWSVGIHATQASEKNSISFRVKEAIGEVNGLIRISSSEPLTSATEARFQFTVE